MPGRKYSVGTGYRYGFNGKEDDDDVKGEGNQQDYGMRIYDTRLGRFLSVDPIGSKYPSWSPYPFAMNRPIDGVDQDGLEWMNYMHSLVNIGGLKYDPVLNQITYFETFYRLDENINPPALIDEIKSTRNSCDNCIGYEAAKVAGFTYKKVSPLIKVDSESSATDMETPSSSKPQNHEQPIVPKNKDEERVQRKTKKFYTDGITSQNEKATALIAAIELTGQLLATLADQNVKDHIQNAQAQSKGVATQAINLLQSELSKGNKSLIPQKYRNSESLNQMANFLLYGEPITTWQMDNKGNFKMNKELTEIAMKIFLPIQKLKESEKQNTDLQKNKADNTRVVKKG